MSEDFRFEVIAAGFTGDSAIPLAAISHDDGVVRASALRALARIGTLTDGTGCIASVGECSSMS